ncbi:Brp/Blh family beta-carotene 15,15'-dioxygenase [Sulfitobacter sp.]|uniref:Brp/Blh family beta-carotene 15,15'-dioxygenase n=1 Tax=Sulfitobacter sp. TaxID=1903071 RepID=UPI003002DE26
MTGTPLWQTWFFACSVLTIIGASFLFQPDMTTQLLMLVPAVAILGLPHGAFDLPIAKSLWPLSGWRGHARFALLYIGLAFLLICIWILFPGPALFAFLIYSAVHFSGDWEDTSGAIRWTGGIATVGAPALFQREEVATIFAHLAPEPTANFVALLLALSGTGALAFAVALVACQPSLRTRAAVEQGIIWIAAACLAPLVYFIVYFCTLHSVRHFTDAISFIEHKRQAMRVAVVLSIVTISASFMGFAIMQKLGADDLEKSVLKIVFIGLAALTVPHMILVDRFQQQVKDR